MADGDVTAEGVGYIKQWQACQHHLESSTRAMDNATSELKKAANELGRWMWPEDGACGEKICVWFGDSLIQAEMPSIVTGDFSITIRKRGRSMM